MGLRSKEKGADYERSICQRLSLWASDMTREDIFWRASMSGGRASLASRKKRGTKFTAQSGDISAIHELGHLFLKLFVVEAKFWRDLEWHKLVYAKRKPDILDEWQKVRELAFDEGRQPFFVVKQNRQPDLVCTTAKGVVIFETGCTEVDKVGRGILLITPTTIFPTHDMHVYLLRDFLTKVSYKILRGIYE